MLNLYLTVVFNCILFNQNVVVVEGSNKSYAIDIVALDALVYHDLMIFNNLKQNQDKNFSAPLHNVLNEYILDFEESHDIQNSKKDSVEDGNWMHIHAKTVADNPLSALRMLWRTVKILPRLQQQIKSENIALFFLRSQRINYKIQTGHFSCGTPHIEIGFELEKLDEEPDEEDLQMVYRGIIHLQLFYQLRPLQLAKGFIQKLRTSSKLHAIHCFEIGFYAATREYFSFGVEWLETAIKLISKKNDTTIDKSRVKKELEKAIDLHDAGHRTVEETEVDGREYNSMFFEYPLRLPKEKDIEHGDLMCNGIIQCAPKKRRRSGWNIKNQPNIRSNPELQALRTHRLCNGENYQSEEEKSKLFCWYEWRANRYFLIGPLKMEFFARNPDVVKVHKLFNETTIQRVEKSAMEISYKREGVAFPMKPLNITGTIPDVDDRMGMKSLIPDLDKKYGITVISRTIQLLTGIQMMRENSTERLRIVSYTFGSHFRNHMDYSGRRTEEGSRVITFMFYMTDVDMGGFTAFPRLGVGVKPEKGSALFWFNVLANGVTVEETTHCACPPLIGRKMSATRYERLLYSFPSLPCLLKENASYSVPVNGQFLLHE